MGVQWSVCLLLFEVTIRFLYYVALLDIVNCINTNGSFGQCYAKHILWYKHLVANLFIFLSFFETYDTILHHMTDMIWESAGSSGQGATAAGSRQMREEGIIALCLVGLGTDFTRSVNLFNWSTNHFDRPRPRVGPHIWIQESCSVGSDEVALTGAQDNHNWHKSLMPVSGPL